MGWMNRKKAVAQDATSLSSREPLARSEGLILEELGDEVLVYDLSSDTAHCLSPDAASVWQKCDGNTSIDDLATQVDLSAERVQDALHELERCELLMQPPTLSGDGHTRRELSLKVAKVGAAAAAMPMIVSVAAPAPAMAATLAFCANFSSGNCGSNTGCSKEVGCCCCSTGGVLHADPGGSGKYTTDGSSPCDKCGGGNCENQCKTCVPCDQDDELCPTFTDLSGHFAKDCSAADAC